MDTVPIWVLVLALVLLILLSAFFAMVETALMAANKYRLRHLAKRGSRQARSTVWLLDHADKLLSVILIANTVTNALAVAIVTSIAVTYFGPGQGAIAASTATIAFLLIVFAEITPKAVGAAYPEAIALPGSIVLKPLLVLLKPVAWFVNLFVSGLLAVARVRRLDRASQQQMTPDELRAVVLEAAAFIPQKHQSILLNLFDLGKVSVDDIMTPRAQIEALNLAVPAEEILDQLTTCYHNKLPVYEGEINCVVGILHVRNAVALLNEAEELTVQHFRELLSEPYFIPQETDVFTQLQYFQENKERLGIIVDEYGEVQGLVTLDDIIEEMVGDFTTSTPSAARAESFDWDQNGECLLEGTTALREVNRRLGLDFPLDGPKTLNGLLLEQLQDIPEAPICLRNAQGAIEVVKVQNQSIKVVKLIRSVNKRHT